MNEKLNKNAKVEQLTKVFLSRGEEKGLIVKDPYCYIGEYFPKHCWTRFYIIFQRWIHWEILKNMIYLTQKASNLLYLTLQ